MKRGEARVAALLAAGAAVLAKKGYEAATMTEIAAQAGASIGSLYQFFPTKALLAAELHAAYLAALAAELETLARDTNGRSAAEIGGALLDRLAGFLDAHPAFDSLAERRDVDPARKRATRAQLRGQIARLLAGAEPTVDPARTDALAAIILHLMKAAVALGREDDPILRDAARAELRRMLVRHLEAG
jgi:AcrR family transcriptional regulator